VRFHEGTSNNVIAQGKGVHAGGEMSTMK
jgi:hypothetical protein